MQIKNDGACRQCPDVTVQQDMIKKKKACIYVSHHEVYPLEDNIEE
ncbi:MAG: hypothetical protein LBR45_03585 [Bacteroidales bacterium]|nr:hypothetical protein [Bacteroidales bacterium]